MNFLCGSFRLTSISIIIFFDCVHISIPNKFTVFITTINSIILNVHKLPGFIPDNFNSKTITNFSQELSFVIVWDTFFWILLMYFKRVILLHQPSRCGIWIIRCWRHFSHILSNILKKLMQIYLYLCKTKLSNQFSLVFHYFSIFTMLLLRTV